jgi:hypothetical protein
MERDFVGHTIIPEGTDFQRVFPELRGVAREPAQSQMPADLWGQTLGYKQ